ncbi:MAG: DNA replication/repair protein RecF [Lachnospiraceae bacterium]|nr:DNA replication/repair protein RecF [Lachnospiraceae bacterium]
MYIESLELSNYRNYEALSMSFANETIILYGDNAQGKTNILESLYVSATTKSHRGSRDKEMIRLGCEEAHIRMCVNKNQMSHRVDMHLRGNKSKGVAIDGIPIKRSSELLGICNIIFFSPEDLSIIKNSPSERRKFMDMELCQLDKVYCHDFMKYNKILNQRNSLLKQISFHASLIDTLDVWDEQLVEYGSRVIKARGDFILRLNDIMRQIHGKLTGQKEHVRVDYEMNVDRHHFSDLLKEKREKDLKYQTTSIGPHRDDLSFFIDDVDVKSFGSQGQQRTTALSLKLSEITLVKKIVGENPILLLDDVMSELDANRRDYLMDFIRDLQTIITCTGYDDFVRNRMKINNIYKVTRGSVHKE